MGRYRFALAVNVNMFISGASPRETAAVPQERGRGWDE